jgi:hypothetical protein
MAKRRLPRRVSVVDLASETQLGRQVLAFNDDEVVGLLRAAIKREGSQVAYARRHGLERTGLNMILRKKDLLVTLL